MKLLKSEYGKRYMFKNFLLCLDITFMKQVRTDSSRFLFQVNRYPIGWAEFYIKMGKMSMHGNNIKMSKNKEFHKTFFRLQNK